MAIYAVCQESGFATQSTNQHLHYSPFGSQSLYQGGSCEILGSRASLCIGLSSSPAHYSPVIIALVMSSQPHHFSSDLKPDNILLDSAGHAHITDFNVAIHYSERRLHTSVAGSMAYMAPQVLGKKGYSWQIDWWSLGVTAYELIFHKRPFDGRSAEKMKESILKDPLRVPSDASKRCSEAGMMALKGVCVFLSCFP